MRVYFLFMACVAASCVVNAQDTLKAAPVVPLESNEEVNILYRHEACGGLTFHSNGWGVTFKSGKHVTGFIKRILDFEFISMSHPKEYRITNPYEGSNSFIYGKMNSVFLLRAGWGYQHMLFGKGERSGVEIRYNYYAGLDLGLAKPVFLDILENDPHNDSLRIVVTKQYDPADPGQTVDNIYGSSSFFTGFDKMKIYPGVYGKFAVSFEYAGWQKRIAAIETGVMADFFPDAIPMMAFNKAENFYFNFYISILWGGKW
ncbi:MAG: hypothetical protein NT126_03675 [Bacteroidetes bacterium]|nr:hypothetical protein [Bacteroidota bacterium]